MWRYLAWGIGTGFVAAVLACLAAGHLLTKPALAIIGSPPTELHAEETNFPSRSGSQIKAWFSQGKSGQGGVLLLHPVRGNRTTMLGRAMFLHALGYSVLLVDLQAHGESLGNRISFGFREGLDAEASVEKLKSLVPDENLGAIGVSLGAASLVLSRAHESLKAVMLESLYPTITEAVKDRLILRFGTWGGPLAPLLLWQLKPWLDVTVDQLQPINAVTHLHSPIMLVHGTLDQHTTISEAKQIFAKISSPKELYTIEGAGHIDLHQFAGIAYERRISQFLSVLRLGKK